VIHHKLLIIEVHYNFEHNLFIIAYLFCIKYLIELTYSQDIVILDMEYGIKSQLNEKQKC